MSRKIIRPEGVELMKYLNDGDAICNQCGALMDRMEDPKGGCDIFTCPACKWTIDEMEYEYEDDELLEVNEEDTLPPGCRACGGPYPQCKTSCKLFDD
jgi:hypothetical protein|nr:MAG TPA: DNA-directed RNA polymerase II subunit [Caudoviricetes sp.]